MRRISIIFLVLLTSTYSLFGSGQGGEKVSSPSTVAPQQATTAPAVPPSDAALIQTPQEETRPAEPSPVETLLEKEKAQEAEKTQGGEEVLPIAPISETKPETATWEDPAPYGSVGLGLGMFYSFFGVNIDVHPIQKQWWNGITITASVGETTIGKFAYAGGLRYFFLPRNYGWRPRITLMYGINATTDYNLTVITDTGSINFREKKTFHGLTIGFGIQYMFGENRRHGLDFDLVVITYSSVNEHIDKLRRDPDIASYVSADDKPFPLVISFGYRFAF